MTDPTKPGDEAAAKKFSNLEPKVNGKMYFPEIHALAPGDEMTTLVPGMDFCQGHEELDDAIKCCELNRDAIDKNLKVARARALNMAKQLGIPEKAVGEFHFVIVKHEATLIEVVL